MSDQAFSDSVCNPCLHIGNGKANLLTADALCISFRPILTARVVRRFSPALHCVPTCSRDRGGGRTQLLLAFVSNYGSSCGRGVAWRAKFNCVEPEEVDPFGTAGLWERTAGVSPGTWRWRILRSDRQRGVSALECSLEMQPCERGEVLRDAAVGIEAMRDRSRDVHVSMLAFKVC